jgi:hypothetical protein
MSTYGFKPYEYPVLTKELVTDILRLKDGKIKISLSLGKDYIYVEKHKKTIALGSLELNLYDISKKMEYGYIYALIKDGLLRISFFKDNKFYKLLSIDPYSAPTLEISGIRMHRTKDILPWDDAALKVAILGKIEGERGLDICTGLGYTAIHALLSGAKSIISIEKDPNVLEIAKYNPWSRELSYPQIHLILADASVYISELGDSSFDFIIHDPPRLSLAGELYSSKFYSELYRVLEKGGRLAHYTGRPRYKVRRMDLMKTVASRLARTGFRTKILRNSYIVVAFK